MKKTILIAAGVMMSIGLVAYTVIPSNKLEASDESCCKMEQCDENTACDMEDCITYCDPEDCNRGK